MLPTTPAGPSFRPFARQSLKTRFAEQNKRKGISMLSRIRHLQAVLLACIIFALPASADEPLFPDKALEAAVRQYVFAKRDNDMPIVAEDVKDISTIIAKNKGIKSLAGLEKCQSLALLDLEGNEVSDLAPIKGLPRLQSLTLAKNKIANLAPLSESKALQLLDLADNQVTDLAPIAGLTSMTTLYLSNNKIQNIEPLAGLTKLWSLDLANNQVTDIKPIAKLKNLTSLHLKAMASRISPR
jgi:internalin A